MKFDVENLRGRRADQRWNRVSMGDLFERVRWGWPEHEVIYGYPGAYENAQWQRLTAAQADDLANQVAHATLAAGAAPGDIVLMVCDNSVEAVVSKIGFAKAGITVAPLNPNLAPDVVDELIKLCKPTKALMDAEYRSRVEPVLQSNGVGLLAAIQLGEHRAAGVPTFTEFVSGHSVSEPDVAIHGDDIWQILFTSGSTAAPKGAMVSHINTMMAALGFTGMTQRELRFESDLVMGTFLPIIYHVGDGTVYSAVLSGGRVVIGRRPEADKLAQAIHEEGITCWWAGSPQAIQAVVEVFQSKPELKGSSIGSIIFGWAPMTPELHDTIKQTLGEHVRCVEIIGQTEVVSAHRFWLDQNADLFARTAPQHNYVGRPHPLMAAAIVDENKQVVPPDSEQIGEAVYRSPALMAGYFRQPEATAEVLADGWFHGGDAFQWGENGERMLVDRFKDIVKTGGENVSSIRVEAVLMRHPAVARAAVVGLQHERWGEAVTALVKTKPGQTVTEDELIAYCKGALAGFEVPKKVIFVHEFPESVGGKLQKHKLRAAHKDAYAASTER